MNDQNPYEPPEELGQPRRHPHLGLALWLVVTIFLGIFLFRGPWVVGAMRLALFSFGGFIAGSAIVWYWNRRRYAER